MNTEVLRRDSLLHQAFTNSRAAETVRSGAQQRKAREDTVPSQPRPTKPSLMNPFTSAAAREQKWELGILTLVAAIALVAIGAGLFGSESLVQRLVELVQAFRG